MNKKSAFTLAELLITMAIIGILIVLGFKTLEHIDRSVKYTYSNVYFSLDRALYNAYYYTNLSNPFVTKDIVDGAEVDVPEEAHPRRLCEMLTEYINTSQVNCDADAVTASGNEFDTSQSTLAQTPHFIASNGVKFYISNVLPEESDAPHHFMLIYADMNGDKKPNSINYNPPGVEPDIFAFAALDIGRVCPLGPPEVDPNYMKTRVSYFMINDVTSSSDPSSDATQATVRFSPISKPYYISKAEAWGYYLANNANRIEDDYYIEANPLTYNGYVKNRLPEGNKIYEFMGGDDSFTAPDSVVLRSEKIEDGGYNCIAGSDVECEVIIDKYLY